MKVMSVTNDIVPIGKFKTGISKWFKSIRDTGRPLIITQNGKPTGVLLTPSEYDELVYKRAFLDSISGGIADAESGRVYSSKQLKREMAKKRQRS